MNWNILRFWYRKVTTGNERKEIRETFFRGKTPVNAIKSIASFVSYKTEIKKTMDYFQVQTT